MRVILDSHPQMVLSSPYDQLNGWVERPVGTDISFRSGSYMLPATLYQRGDLDPASAVGFTASLDLVDLNKHGAIRGGFANIEILENGSPIDTVSMKVDGLGVDTFSNIATKKQQRRQFIQEHWRGSPPQSKEGITALYALPDDWSMDPRIEHSSDIVCRHYYDPMVYEFLKNDGKPGMFLEVGAGLRFVPADNVVTVEICDYPSTDVLAVGENLPFEDNTFDGAMAMNVLEHVRNPFVCADELMRVVKPGGKIYIMLPFMAPEHGYPSHYFNATRFGVLELFKSCRLEKQIVHPSSHPIGALGNFLSVYSQGLTGSALDEFLLMSVNDLLKISFTRDHPIVSELDGETAFKICWGTTTTFING